MPRIARMIISEEKSAYHVMSRTALDGLPFGPVEKDAFVRILKRLSRIYFTKILGYAVMGNHFHLLVTMLPHQNFSDEDIKARFLLCYGEEAEFPEGRIAHYRRKWASLSELVRELKQTFSRYYNREKKRRGPLWGERFKSVIVEKGDTLINCLAYIDLNAVRAGIVKRPDDYRWCSLGYHSQSGNKDGFLSTDFGLLEFGELDEKERYRRYRRYVYEAGAVEKHDGKRAKTLDQGLVEKERENDFVPTATDRFLRRTRYFTDSGVIGTRAFVAEKARNFRHLFQARHEKIPKRVEGLNGFYSLKRLTS